ncbi:HNH endonuclease signature motif containing protein [Leucobacter sp. L43]|uniref:HNH endonuclease signature motif containing protein n=1 Tax=Leucobacter sp. L43 TaxID=2798040 RepID=UPI001906117F|nr:HNH endonuclease signature motif containing protein [Leucobacter sp. L43]
MEASPHIREAQSSELDALVNELASVEQQLRGLEARKRALLSRVRAVSDTVCAEERRTGRSAELVHRAAAGEVGFALGIADRSAEGLIERSFDLCTKFPAAHASLAAGRISAAHAAAVAEAGLLITDSAARRAYTRVALDIAEAETPNRARRAAKVLAERFAGRTFAERCERAAAERRVWVTPLDDGMAELHAVVDAVLASALHDRLTRVGQAQVVADREQADRSTSGRGAGAGAGGADAGGASAGGADAGGADAGDTDAVAARADDAVVVRTLDQARADLFVDVLLNGDPSGLWRSRGGVSGERIDARVQVIVPVSALAGARAGAGAGAGPSRIAGVGPGAEPPGSGGSDGSEGSGGSDGSAPAMLAGYGVIGSDRARLLAGLARGWDRVAVDDASGAVLAVDRYRPSEELLRYLRARDQHCRFPGCQVVPFRADVDHTHDAARGGATSVVNLAVLCRRHHTMKHHAGMTMTQHPDGDIEWVTALGRRKRERPPSRVMFAPAPAHERSRQSP